MINKACAWNVQLLSDKNKDNTPKVQLKTKKTYI